MKFVLLMLMLAFGFGAEAKVKGRAPFNPTCIDCFNFVAPSVMGAENIDPAEIGLIVYDYDFGVFRGYTESGAWGRLSAESSIATVSTTSTLNMSHDFVLADSSSGTLTLTLPPAADLVGKTLTVKKSVAANSVILDGNLTETIDGLSSLTLVTQNATVEIVSDGVNFRIKSNSDKWRAEANITGANPSLGVSAVTAYTEITNSALTMTPASGSIPVGIACATGTASVVGSNTCSSNESIGITFNLPNPASVRACAFFGATIDLSSCVSCALTQTFQIVETSASSSTVTQEGKSRTSGRLSKVSASAGVSEVTHPFSQCGTFVFATSGQKTLRLAFEQSISGAPTASTVLADAAAADGQRDVHWEIYPLN